MLLINFKNKTTLTVDELRELLILAECQETTNKETSTELEINGDYANISVSIDEDGDITI